MAIRYLSSVIVSYSLVTAALAAAVAIDCDNGASINATVLKAQPRDVILISGTCKEQVQIPPEVSNITIDGQKKTTIIYPGGQQQSPHVFYNRGKEITIKNLTVTGGPGDGIHLSGPASAFVDGVLVTKVGGRGIHIDKGSVIRIINTTVEGSGGIGIDVTGASYAYIGVYIPRVPTVSPVTVRNNGGPGINIERTAGAWIVGNTITGNKESGISVHRNAQADVIGNKIDGNGGDGVTAMFGGGINFISEPRKDGPNQTTQNNAGFGIRCSTGGYVDGPLGSLAGAKGAKSIEAGCVDRALK